MDFQKGLESAAACEFVEMRYDQIQLRDGKGMVSEICGVGPCSAFYEGGGGDIGLAVVDGGVEFTGVVPGGPGIDEIWLI